MPLPRSVAGISLKTQELYFLVFVTRYLDLFHSASLYLFVMKLIYIAASGAIVYVMRFKHPWNTTYETPTKAADKFPHIKFAILPCLAIATFINEGSVAGEDGVTLYSLAAYTVEVGGVWCVNVFMSAQWLLGLHGPHRCAVL